MRSPEGGYVRDMELVRALLIYIAEKGGPNRQVPQPSFEKYLPPLVSYHRKMMHEHGLFDGTRLANQTWLLRTLTWEGQDFLQAARNDTIWAKVKSAAGDMWPALSLEILKELKAKATRE